MQRIGTAEFDLKLLEGELSSVLPMLEVSLDCPGCKRRNRTVVFDQLGVQGRCLPTKHESDGSLVSMERRRTGAVARFRYQYTPFVDAKYPDEKHYGADERGAPTWVRFHFVMRCSRCGDESKGSTQSNIVRPWQCECTCGAPLYVDERAPRMSWTPAEA